MPLTTDFVAAVRRQGSIPSTTSAADILAEGDLCIVDDFVPLLEELRQNYFIREMTVSPDGRGRIAIPPRAVGATVRSVQLALQGGWVPLAQRDLADADYVANGPFPDGFAIDGGSIILLPTGSSGTLRLRYPARPGKMVLDTDANNAGRIDSLITGATTYTITTSPVFTGGSIIDVVSYGPAHQQKCLTATRAGLVLQQSDFLETPVVGDWLCTFDTSPFVPLPEELYGALVHATAANLLLARGYLAEAAAQQATAKDKVLQAKKFLIPRLEGNPKTVSGGLRRSMGSTGRATWRGRWW